MFVRPSDAILTRGSNASAVANFTFFHGKHDTVVPIDNLNGIKQKWSSSVYKLVTCPNIYDHGKLAAVFFLQLHDKYVQEMFKREWKPGTFSFVTADPVK